MAAPKDEVKDKNFSLDKSDFSLIDENGNPVKKYTYMVYSIEAKTDRKTWFLIPELQKAYSKYTKAMEEGGVASTATK